MKVTVILISLVLVFVRVGSSLDTEQRVCGGSCMQSSDCARSCRCSYYTCANLETPCMGGCMTSDQCRNWSGGDTSCVCTWWFECEAQSVLQNPGYKPFLKIAAMAKAKKENFRILSSHLQPPHGLL